jgi:hypothetical protein
MWHSKEAFGRMLSRSGTKQAVAGKKQRKDKTSEKREGRKKRHVPSKANPDASRRAILLGQRLAAAINQGERRCATEKAARARSKACKDPGRPYPCVALSVK